jgi:glycosyltransferase involved in cell wall biosynthesis
MRIAFVHSNKAFLPALHAYTRFFGQYNISVEITTSEHLDMVKRDLDWHFMGFDFGRPDEEIIRIHDYCSTSTPPMRKLKDFAKSYFNSQPDLRIFQNEFVRSAFSFHDKVPFCFRDVGIEKEWLNLADTSIEKEYDFIYCGDLSEKRKPEQLVDVFTRPDLKSKTLLLLSRDFEALEEKYRDHPNIIFRGPVEKDEVKQYIKRSRFGINFIPALKPYTELSSTKFLEYLACGIPVVSTDYHWVREFQRRYGGSFYFLDNSFSNFTWDNITAFNYSSPDLTNWTWDEQILRSGICDFLKTNFSELDLPSKAGLVNIDV